MKKRNRLKKNEDFQKVFKHGTSVANRQFVLYTLDQPENDELRVGLSVSKKNWQCSNAESDKTFDPASFSRRERQAEGKGLYYYCQKTSKSADI